MMPSATIPDQGLIIFESMGTDSVNYSIAAAFIPFSTLLKLETSRHCVVIKHLDGIKRIVV